MVVVKQCSNLFGRSAEQGAPVYSSDAPCMTNVFTPLNLRIQELEEGLPCYVIALGSGKALRFMRQLSGDGTISEQCLFSGSLQYGTPHMW